MIIGRLPRWPMAVGRAEAFAWCRQLVKQHDSAEYCCTLFLPSTPRDARGLKFALSALNIETGKITNISTSGDIRMARLQYWIDAISSLNAPAVRSWRALHSPDARIVGRVRRRQSGNHGPTAICSPGARTAD